VPELKPVLGPNPIQARWNAILRKTNAERGTANLGRPDKRRLAPQKPSKLPPEALV